MKVLLSGLLVVSLCMISCGESESEETSKEPTTEDSDQTDEAQTTAQLERNSTTATTQSVPAATSTTVAKAENETESKPISEPAPDRKPEPQSSSEPAETEASSPNQLNPKAKAAINGLAGVYRQYHATLKRHVDNPRVALAEGAKFVTNNTEKLRRFGRQLGNNIDRSADSLEAAYFQKTMNDIDRSVMGSIYENLAPKLDQEPGAEARLQKQISRIGRAFQQAQADAQQY